jgi:hypothetical protein
MTFKEIYEEVIWNLNKERRGITPTDSNLISSIKKWINIKQKEICRIYNFYFMEDLNPDVPTADGTQTYPLTDFSPNFKEILNLMLIYDTNKINRLNRWEGIEVESKFSTTDYKSMPTNYWLWENKLWLYPIPDAVYLLRMKSYNYFPDLNLDTDENEITKNFSNLLIYSVCAEGAHWLQEDNTMWMQKYNANLDNIIRYNNRRANQDRKIKINIKLK